MPKETKIQRRDSTVNPIMGCTDGELFPTPGKVLGPLDLAIAKMNSSWKAADARKGFKALINEAYAAIEQTRQIATKTGSRI